MIQSLWKNLVGDTLLQAGFQQGNEIQLPSAFKPLRLYDGIDTKDQTKVTIFSIAKDVTIHENYVKNHIRRLKTLHYPHILRCLATTEDTNAYYWITEKCEPLILKGAGSETTLGLFQILSAIDFLHQQCQLIHGLINPLSIFLSAEGGWKLSTFDCCTAITTRISNLQPDIERHPHFHEGWRPPFFKYCQYSSIAIDRWGFASLILWAHNPKNHTLSGQSITFYRYTLDISDAQLPNIWKEIVHKFQNAEFIHEDLQNVLENNPLFSGNKAVKVMKFIRELALKNDNQKSEFFLDLLNTLNELSDYLVCGQLYAEISKSLSICEACIDKAITVLIKIGSRMTPNQYEQLILPTIVDLLKSNNRLTRFTLLQNMEELSKHWKSDFVQNTINDPIVKGLTDTSRLIREATIKALIFIFPRITGQQITKNLKLLQRCITDSEPIIRINTVVCIAKISSYIPKDALVSMMSSSLKCLMSDNNSQCRHTGIQAISAVIPLYTPEQTVQVIPVIYNSLLDPDSETQAACFHIFEYILHTLRRDSKIYEKEKTVDQIKKPSTNTSSVNAGHQYERTQNTPQQNSYSQISISSNSDQEPRSYPSSHFPILSESRDASFSDLLSLDDPPILHTKKTEASAAMSLAIGNSKKDANYDPYQNISFVQNFNLLKPSQQDVKPFRNPAEIKAYKDSIEDEFFAAFSLTDRKK